MWPLGIILLPPCFDLAPCISQSGEPVEVQTLIPELSLKAFDKGILHGFPRIDVDNTDLVLFRPREEGVCRKLRTIVGNNILRFSPCLYEPVEHPGNDLCGDRGVHMDDRALPCGNVKDREAPECPSPRGSVMNKIKGPLVIDALRNRQGDPKGKRGSFFLGFVLIARASCRYKRSVLLWLITRPSFLRRRWSRRTPYRGFSRASIFMRSRRVVSLCLCGIYRQTERLTASSVHAFFSVCPKC